MAEILVKAFTVNHDNATFDRRGCFKRGDPVIVMPDGHQWGQGERPPKFILVKIPGLDVTVASALYVCSKFSQILDMNGKPIVARRRNVSVDIDQLSVSGDGDVILSKDQFDALLTREI